jgi:hypothetical protein
VRRTWFARPNLPQACVSIASWRVLIVTAVDIFSEGVDVPEVNILCGDKGASQPQDLRV